MIIHVLNLSEGLIIVNLGPESTATGCEITYAALHLLSSLTKETQ